MHKKRRVAALGWAMLSLGIIGARGAELAGQAADVQHPIVIPPPDAAGGGWAYAGPEGAYFANPDLAGDPAFIRRDVRVAFDWGKSLPVGGSTAEPYKSFPRSRFSVRWIGRALPRFSEDYTFTVRATDGARLKVKPAGADEWMLAVDRWNQAGTWSSRPVRLAAGQMYEVALEYHHLTGPAAVELRWSCPSAPEQVVDPVVAQALNVGSWGDYCWADEFKTSHYCQDQKPDAHGYPTSDFQLSAGEGKAGVEGTYDLIFQGRAKVATQLAGSTFTAGKQTWQNALPYGAAYDPARNTTHANVRIGNKEGLWMLGFTSPRRRAGAEAGNDGVTGLHLMRPIRPGADAAHRPDEIVYRPLKKAVAPYTCLRWLQIANATNDADWSKRSRPGQLEFTAGGLYAANTGGEVWELLVVLANECGKDLYVALPMQADDAYIEKFARLIRYGSDGAAPYDHEVENPKWPPLNPNLRLYVEVGNEIWNWGFGSTQYCAARNDKEIKARTPDGKIVGYDGQGNWRRWHALRTVRASDVFRRVSGDAAMASRVRMLMEYQYNNEQGTAKASFDFLDAWFNNGDGPHVAHPHPARHWIWGGAARPTTASATATAARTWCACPMRTSRTALSPTAANRRPPPAAVGPVAAPQPSIAITGYRSTVLRAASRELCPRQPPPVAPSGWTSRSFCAGLAAGCGPTPARTGSSSWDRKGSWPRARSSPSSTACPRPRVGLGRRSRATPRGWSRGWTIISWPRPNMAARIFSSRRWRSLPDRASASWRRPRSPPAAPIPRNGKLNVPPRGPSVSVRWRSAPPAPPTPNPRDCSIRRWAARRPSCAAGGVLSTKVHFPKAGHFALELHAAGQVKGWPGYLPFTISVGGKKVNPKGQGDERVNDEYFVIGGFERRPGELNETWGSAVFAVDAPGDVELRIAAAAKTEGWTVFDEIRVASVDALMESGFGAGEAYGQVAQNNYAKQLNGQAAYARSFGLPVVAYEAGWSLGSDFFAKPIHTWCKFEDARATRINDTAEDIFLQSGGFMNTWGVYIYWPPHDMTGALSYPLMRSLAGIETRLPPEPANGIPLPGRLVGSLQQVVPWGYYDGKPFSTFDRRGQWKSWLALAPKSGVWMFTVRAQGAGVWELEVDGVSVARGSGVAAAPAAVRLVQGQHGVRLRNRGGAFHLDAIEVAAAK